MSTSGRFRCARLPSCQCLSYIALVINFLRLIDMPAVAFHIPAAQHGFAATHLGGRGGSAAVR